MMLHGLGVLLLSAVAGYWVLERAATHKGYLKRIGQLVGGIIILFSLIGIACLAGCPIGTAGFMGKGRFCPLPSNQSSPAPSTK